MVDYSEKVIKHFLNPQNMGKIENPDGVGVAGNIACGDEMTISIKLKRVGGDDRENDVLEEVKFETLGCAAAIAASSMITELAKGKTIREAKQISRKDVAGELGGLPPIKMHCSNMAADALRKAIEDCLAKSQIQNSKS
ncbi:MAG: iron-sulfur cluster assembly scaffold protein [Candidatus Portnoybacteria bacterium]|nr:iron-sulfur cluster assembly scaffold protein [Candidatus Portnoybacteria bacterium]